MTTVENKQFINSSSKSGYYNFRKYQFITNISYKVRRKIYELFIAHFPYAQKIADIGVAAEEISKEANVLEYLYPHKERITAIGIENAEFLEKKYPRLKYVQIQPGQKLPFEDNYFDVVYSHAVIEHIVNEEQREFLLKEAIRIGKCTFITTPNKYFPIETHTLVPFLHFVLPSIFYFLLDIRIINRFYNRNNLRLLAKKDLSKLAKKMNYNYDIFNIKLFGLVSNLVLVIYKNYGKNCISSRPMG